MLAFPEVPSLPAKGSFSGTSSSSVRLFSKFAVTSFACSINSKFLSWLSAYAELRLKNIQISDLTAKLKEVDKKTLIKFGIGFGGIILFLIIYYAVLSPIVKQKKNIIRWQDFKRKWNCSNSKWNNHK